MIKHAETRSPFKLSGQQVGMVLTRAYRSTFIMSAVIFCIVLTATIAGWWAANLSLMDISLFGVLMAAVIAYTVLVFLQSKIRKLSTEKEQAVELAKDELLSLASHQLRTPATGVKQYIGMVLQGFAGKVPAAQRRLLDKAYASNDRQLRIINEILHLAKIGSGRIVLAKQLTDLSELINDVLSEQRAEIDAAKHTISVKLPKRPFQVLADTHMLRMALENIVSNAVKYTPRGGKIVIHVYRKGSDAVVSVSDSGVGIKPEDQDRIFRQFARLPNEMSQQVGGTGIGLYLSRSLIEMHKGKITLQSKLDKGSTFTVILPLRGHVLDSLRGPR